MDNSEDSSKRRSPPPLPQQKKPKDQAGNAVVQCTAALPHRNGDPQEIENSSQGNASAANKQQIAESSSQPPVYVKRAGVNPMARLRPSSSLESTQLATIKGSLHRRSTESSLSLDDSAVTNRPRRLRSGKCREDWILPKKLSFSSISEDDTFTLAELVENYSKYFPLSVSIIKGVEGGVLPNSTMNIHFLKETKVIDISDAINQRYLVPYNSAMKCGLIYCPGVKAENYFFEKVSDIIQALDLPKVVTCTKKAKNKNENSSIGLNEVLIVIEVINPPQAKSSKKSKLKVFSFTHKREKILPGDLAGRFTTNPKLARFHLADIVKHIPDPFPVSARLFLEPGTESSSSTLSFSGVLLREPVTMLESTVETSVIASCHLQSSEPEMDESTGSGPGSGKSVVVEVPVSDRIQVSLKNRDTGLEEESSLEMLHASTLSVWADLLSLAGEHPHRLPLTGERPDQHKLFTMICKGLEKEGQALKAPHLISKDLYVDVGAYASPINYKVLEDGEDGIGYMPLLSSSVSSDYYSTTGDDAELAGKELDDNPFSNSVKNMVPPVSAKETHRDEDAYEKEHQNNRRLVRRIEALEMRITTAAPQENVRRLTRRIEALESRLLQEVPLLLSRKSSNKREEELELQVGMLKMALESLEEQVRILQVERNEMMEKEVAKPSATENIAQLKELDTDQVGRLLDSLELHQYKPTFTEEAITGEILAECNEELLMQELGITNKDHVSKLLQVIQGVCPPQALLAEGKDAIAYVKFNKPPEIKQ